MRSLRLSMDFNEGDIQFINNHQILHAREDFIDHEDPKLKGIYSECGFHSQKNSEEP